jgi:uncharacterized protein (DUF1778 family)
MSKKRNARSLAAKLRKDSVVRMRVSADDKEALEKAADRAGLDLSVWLRQLALREAGVLPVPK